MTVATTLRSNQLTPAEAMDAAYAGGDCHLLLADGRRSRVHTELWSSDASDDDIALFVDPCDGTTLDVGCGPGRLAGALAGRGVPVTGIDISPEAVRQTRARGARAVLGDVFGLSGARWCHLLLADGNVGIGGDPVRLLSRVREALLPGGTALVELSPTDGLRVHHQVRLRVAGRATPPFAWATVGPSAIAEVARAAGLRLDRLVELGGRSVATLART